MKEIEGEMKIISEIEWNWNWRLRVWILGAGRVNFGSGESEFGKAVVRKLGEKRVI